MIDEEKLLKSFAKALGAENVLSAMEEKKIKEKKLLESMDRALYRISNPPIEDLAPAVNVKEELKEEAVSEEVTLITEIGRQPEPQLPKNDIINATVKALSAAPQEKIQQVADGIPDSYRKELDIIKKSIADFHRFALNHSQLGGGGAGDMVHLDHPAKTVYSDYTFTNKDYYVGVGATPATITLPAKAKNGRYIIIKDEVGNCSSNPITVLGTVDNDSGGFILAENNGGVQMIYNNGSWRIV
jgi:hypothetical protein